MQVHGKINTTGNVRKFGRIGIIRVVDEVDFTTNEPPVGTNLIYINTTAGVSNVTSTTVNSRYIYYSPTGSTIWTEVVPDQGTFIYNSTSGLYKYFSSSNWVTYDFGSVDDEVQVQDVDFAGATSSKIGYAYDNDRLFYNRLNLGNWYLAAHRAKIFIPTGTSGATIAGDAFYGGDGVSTMDIFSATWHHISIGNRNNIVLTPVSTSINGSTAPIPMVANNVYIFNCFAAEGWYTRPDKDQFSYDVNFSGSMTVNGTTADPTFSSTNENNFAYQYVGRHVLCWGYYTSSDAVGGAGGAGDYFVTVPLLYPNIDPSAHTDMSISGTVPGQAITGIPVGHGMASYLNGGVRHVGRVVVFQQSNNLFFAITKIFGESGNVPHGATETNIMSNQWFSFAETGLRLYFTARLATLP